LEKIFRETVDSIAKLIGFKLKGIKSGLMLGTEKNQVVAPSRCLRSLYPLLGLFWLGAENKPTKAVAKQGHGKMFGGAAGFAASCSSKNDGASAKLFKSKSHFRMY